jgi:tripartite-type tricarboxylate transporter receptor subunit TctC
LISSWSGLLAPAKTPPAAIEKLHGETVKALKLPELRERLANEGAEPVGNTPPEFTDYLR